MGLRPISVYGTVSFWLVSCLLVAPRLAFGAPDQTMSIVPAASSGASILASDENTRNSNISTPYNAHTHTDLSTTSANTFNIGDGAAGNKNLCANAADGTDSCLRWNDTANVWTIDQPIAGTFNQIAVLTGTAGVTGILQGDGTGALTQFAPSPSGDDMALISDSSSAGTFRTVPNCTDTGGNHLNYTQSTNSFSCGTSAAATFSDFAGSFTRDTSAASGTSSVTGVGFQPTSVSIACAEDATEKASWGWSEGSTDVAIASSAAAGTDATFTNDANDCIYIFQSGSDVYEGDISTFNADGFTVNWTKTGSTTGTITCNYLALK